MEFSLRSRLRFPDQRWHQSPVTLLQMYAFHQEISRSNKAHQAKPISGFFKKLKVIWIELKFSALIFHRLNSHYKQTYLMSLMTAVTRNGFWKSPIGARASHLFQTWNMEDTAFGNEGRSKRWGKRRKLKTTQNSSFKSIIFEFSKRSIWSSNHSSKK